MPDDEYPYGFDDEDDAFAEYEATNPPEDELVAVLWWINHQLEKPHTDGTPVRTDPAGIFFVTANIEGTEVWATWGVDWQGKRFMLAKLQSLKGWLG